MMDRKWGDLGRGGQDGFSLIEMLATLAIASVLLTLSATAIRHFWLTRSLEASADEAVTQLRQLHQDATSQSHPQVFGAIFSAGSGQWRLVQYDPTGGGTGTPSCTSAGTRTFPTGVTVQSVDFGTATAEVTAACAVQPSEEIALFYARGTATPGSLTLVQPALPGRDRTVTVSQLTGRVTRSST